MSKKIDIMIGYLRFTDSQLSDHWSYYRKL